MTAGEGALLRMAGEGALLRMAGEGRSSGWQGRGAPQNDSRGGGAPQNDSRGGGAPQNDRGEGAPLTMAIRGAGRFSGGEGHNDNERRAGDCLHIS